MGIRAIVFEFEPIDGQDEPCRSVSDICEWQDTDRLDLAKQRLRRSLKLRRIGALEVLFIKIDENRNELFNLHSAIWNI